MRILLALPAFALALATPAMATTAMTHPHKSSAMMKSHHAMSGAASTTPSVNRPGDADLGASNRKGGTGGKNSSGNGS